MALRRLLTFSLVVAALAWAAPAATATPPRAWPDTTSGIHIFNDQLPTLVAISDAQVNFAATHYIGVQKMTRPDADRLRSINSGFLILHYRLGPGLGYRAPAGNCQPTGEYLAIVEGDEWVQEWPGEGVVQSSWFFPWAGQPRVFMCDWGWYLMELNNASYRSWWIGEVLRQLAANDNDGLFADSLSVPNYMGGSSFSPPLPDYDAAFEAAWSARIRDWIAYVKGQFGSAYKLVPNVGAWVTTRDATDYTGADGVMIEAFAEWGPGSPFDLADWQLQMDRILSLTRLSKIIIVQQYTDESVADRMFLLSNYLLVKGTRSYVNLDIGLDPEWWPEYEIPIGSYEGGIPASVSALYDAASGVYRRAYSNGLTLVNPDAEPHTVTLGQTYYRATPVGGGLVPESGSTNSWRVDYAPVTSVVLGPSQGAILLTYDPSAGAHFDLQLRRGWNLASFPLTVTDANPRTLFAPIEGKYSLAHAWNSATQSWQTFSPSLPDPQSLDSLDFTRGFWILMTEDATLGIEGSQPDETSIPLAVGWNLVGFPAGANRDVEAALTSIAGKYTSIYEYDANPSASWKRYSPGAPAFSNTLSALRPGKGYWIRATQPCTWVVTW